jgi:hypothetical protein
MDSTDSPLEKLERAMYRDQAQVVCALHELISVPVSSSAVEGCTQHAQ